ncbi:MAG TPA: glycosyltransferase family A protein [Acidimicrobiales bacterium]|nr:glycosyltransferase family A protein [Acidimicrobiales bacterium]
MTLDQHLSSPGPLGAPSASPYFGNEFSGNEFSGNEFSGNQLTPHGRLEVPVAVLVPTHRRKAHLEKALRSIANQRHVFPCEVIVIDDASGDGTSELAGAWGATVIEKKMNEGPGAARDDGARAAASAEWLAMLDDDDEWLPGHLATLWENRHGHVMVAGSSVDIGQGPPRAHGAATARAETVRSPGRLVFPENSFTTSATMLRRDVLLSAGGFDRNVRHAEDLDAWLRVLEKGTGLILPEVTCFYRVHGAQTSRDRGAMTGSCVMLFEKYSDRPWMTSRLREQAMAVNAWDDFQAARADGDKRAMLRAVAWLGRHPYSAMDVPRLWAYRRNLRRRGWAEAQRLGLIGSDSASANTTT